MSSELKITLESLYDILRQEKQLGELLQLERTYYQDVIEYVQHKNAPWPKSNHFEGDSEKHHAELRTVRRFIKEIFEKREKKIIEMALNRCRTGAEISDTSRLLDEERVFYNELIALFEKFRMDVLHSMLSTRSSLQFQQVSQPATSAVVTQHMKYLCIEDVPQFIGPDLKHYGPFKKEETVELPSEITELLLKKNLVQRIS